MMVVVVVMMMMMLVFWGGLLAVVLVILRHFTSGSSRQRNANAEELLGERLARGEIDETEYTKRRDILRSRPRGIPDSADVGRDHRGARRL